MKQSICALVLGSGHDFLNNIYEEPKRLDEKWTSGTRFSSRQRYQCVSDTQLDRLSAPPPICRGVLVTEEMF